MAAPKKIGINYFSFDVDFFEDEKMEAISGEFGIKGEMIAIRLLCAVYRQGYFAIWNEQFKLKLSNRCKLSPELVEQVVNRLVKWEFLNEDLFNSDKVLTSRGIQKRYKEATTKRKNIDYEKLQYWIKESKCTVNGGINSATEELMGEETPQSKVNKSKVNESIVVLATPPQNPIVITYNLPKTNIENSEVSILDNDFLSRCYRMNLKTTDEVSKVLEKFNRHRGSIGKQQDLMSEYRQHFFNWIGKGGHLKSESIQADGKVLSAGAQRLKDALTTKT